MIRNTASLQVGAVSTLEIEVAGGQEKAFKRQVVDFIARFESAPGCLAYGLTRSTEQPHMWLLSGFWASREAMTAHFAAGDFNLLIWLISRRAVSVRFTHYLPHIQEDIAC